MNTCEDWKDVFIASVDRNFLCKEFDNYLEITTPLMLPDGDAVSVYVKHDFDAYTVTDLGELFHYLIGHDICPPLSSTLKQIIDDILRVNKTVLHQDEIKCHVSDVESLPFAVFRVAQSVVRAAERLVSQFSHR